MLKLGLGLYRRMLTPENFRFARQAGATHIVAHLVDYLGDARLPDSRERKFTWGVTSNEGRLLDLVPSRSNAIEFCQGTVVEMVGEGVYDVIEEYSRMGAIASAHFRNVRGTVPDYREVFLDEGDVDMLHALELYVQTGFDGVIIPDHTPQMTCPAPWHAGMAHALGWMQAAVEAASREEFAVEVY